MTERGLTDFVRAKLASFVADGLLTAEDARRFLPIATLIAAEALFSAAPEEGDEFQPPDGSMPSGGSPFSRDGSDWVFRRPGFG